MLVIRTTDSRGAPLLHATHDDEVPKHCLPLGLLSLGRLILYHWLGPRFCLVLSTGYSLSGYGAPQDSGEASQRAGIARRSGWAVTTTRIGTVES